MKNRYFGRIYLCNISEDRVIKSVCGSRFMRPYALFSEENIPPKYVALQGEFFRIVLAGLAHDTKCLFLQDFQKTFHLALSISELLKDRIVLAHRKIPLQDGSTLKAYCASNCIMKLGEDNDEELMYRVRESEEEEVRDVFYRFFENDNISISDIEGLLAYLGLAPRDMGFQEACNLLGSRILLFIDKTSRLYLEM